MTPLSLDVCPQGAAIVWGVGECVEPIAMQLDDDAPEGLPVWHRWRPLCAVRVFAWCNAFDWLWWEAQLHRAPFCGRGRGLSWFRCGGAS